MGDYPGAERAEPFGGRRRRTGSTNSLIPRHCSALGKPFKCGDPSRAHKKQKQRMKQWIALNNIQNPPNPETVNRREADDFINTQFDIFRRRILNNNDNSVEL
jgi:hypothetical protein